MQRAVGSPGDLLQQVFDLLKRCSGVYGFAQFPSLEEAAEPGPPVAGEPEPEEEKEADGRHDDEA